MQAIILRLPDHTYVIIRMCLQMNMLQLFFVFEYGNACEEGGRVGETASSLTFSSGLVREVQNREMSEKRVVTSRGKEMYKNNS